MIVPHFQLHAYSKRFQSDFVDPNIWYSSHQRVNAEGCWTTYMILKTIGFPGYIWHAATDLLPLDFELSDSPSFSRFRYPENPTKFIMVHFTRICHFCFAEF